MRPLAVVAAALVAMFGAGAATRGAPSARAGAPCGLAMSKVVTYTPQAAVVRVPAGPADIVRYHGCYLNGPRFRLVTADHGAEPQHVWEWSFRLAGPYAAFAFYGCGEECTNDIFTVKDLRTGRTKRQVDVDDYVDTEGARTQAVFLTAFGALAWVEQGDQGSRRIVASDRRGRYRVLARSRPGRLPLRKVRLEGARLRWTQSGRARSARLF